MMNTKKSKIYSGYEEVVEFLEKLKHPFKLEIMELRRIILGATTGITEHIKWNAPSFCFNNEDRITMNLAGNNFIRLVFHCGAKVRDTKEQLFEDNSGFLEWASKDRAIIKFKSMQEIKNKETEIVELVNKWISVTQF